jgi:hemerythrin-like domain-containing protein
MKRHAALQQLSRDHHKALKLARQASFAADSGHVIAIAEAAQVITTLFPEWIEEHFRSEENDLLPALAAAGGGELVRQIVDQHAELRALNRQLATPDGATLSRFGKLLTEHVRFEEREVFETAQTLLYPASTST